MKFLEPPKELKESYIDFRLIIGDSNLPGISSVFVAGPKTLVPVSEAVTWVREFKNHDKIGYLTGTSYIIWLRTSIHGFEHTFLIQTQYKTAEEFADVLGNTLYTLLK